jgi:prevent-host-death family protein
MVEKKRLDFCTKFRDVNLVMVAGRVEVVYFVRVTIQPGRDGSQSMRRISTGDARSRFAEIIKEAAYGSKRTVITRHGKEIAAVVPIEDVQELPAGTIQILQSREILTYSPKALLKNR